MTMDFLAAFSSDSGSSWAAQVENRLGRGDGSVLGGVLGLLRPRTLTTPARSERHDPPDVTDGGVTAWAGTTPVLGGLCRPTPHSTRQTSGGFRGSVPPTLRMNVTGRISGSGPAADEFIAAGPVEEKKRTGGDT